MKWGGGKGGERKDSQQRQNETRNKIGKVVI